MELVMRRIGPAILTLAAGLALTAAVPPTRIIVLGTFLAFAALLIGLDLMVGDTGLLAMGHAAFFGVGAYVSTILWQHYDWSMLVAAPVAVATAAVLAVVIGYPAASRTTGLYFSIITFAFGQILVVIVNQTTEISGGSEGLPSNFGVGSDLPFGWDTYRTFTAELAIILAASVLVASLVRNSHFGLRLRAVKSSENLTQGLGFNPTLYKTTIFVIGSSIAATAGVGYAQMSGFINPSLMDVQQSIYFIGLLFVGGMMSAWGAVVGVALLATLPQLIEMDPTARPVLVGLAMAAVVLGAPGIGVVGLVRRAFDAALGRRRRDPLLEVEGTADTDVAP